MLLGALEAGGTKMVCAVGDEQGNLFARESFPTRMPEETMPQLIAWFREKGVEALGIGSFGPLNLDPSDAHFGDITTTPKAGWKNYPLRAAFAEALGVPVGIDTDVNAAALGESVFGAGQGAENLVYFTVGTGVGAGILTGGRLLHGLVHPEMGHIPMRPHPQDPAPRGFCPYHESCLEGMACGTAIEKRWGIPAPELPEDHIAWTVEVEYLAQMCVSAILTVSPQVIVLGGGVMQQAHLFPRVRARVLEMLGGYVAHPAVLENIDSYIVAPGLGNNAGAVGSLLLAKQALEDARG